MEQILHTFGIDWRLLLINGVNFGLLLAVLGYFLYGPVMRMLEERREKVLQGIKDAEEAARLREEIAASRAATLAEAGKEADAVVASARAAGAAKERDLIEKGEAAAEAVLRAAEAEAEELKVQAIEKSKQEVAKLIVLGVEKALGRSPTGEAMQK